MLIVGGTALAHRRQPTEAGAPSIRMTSSPNQPGTATQPMAEGRSFANHLRVGFNRLEFLLDFAQAYDGCEEVVHAKLVTTPAHVKQFAALMHGCVSDYEKRYGVIATDGTG